MKPGRDLDHKIATEIFNYECWCEPGANLRYRTIPAEQQDPYDPSNDFPVPHYSTDIAAAWEVVEKLKVKPMDNQDEHTNGFNVTLELKYQISDKWHAYWYGGPWAEAETAPHAICLAALKAKGIEV